MNVVWRRWALGFLVWTVLALLSASQMAVFLRGTDQAVEWSRLVPQRLVEWYSCAVFTPVFFAAARRWPIDARSWLRHAPVHLLLCAVATVIKFAIDGQALSSLLSLPVRPLGAVLQRNFIPENVAFWCMAAVVHAIEFQRTVREREVLSARLQARLSAAQLASLAARLHPHFLFNTLQGISTLVHRDPAAADAMLGHLSTLLRRMLQTRVRHEVTLVEELALLEEYLAIAQTRFGDRLTIVRDVAADALPGLVPYLVLQPILENAFEHGIARRGGAGLVELRAAREGERLRITVTDDGHGPRRDTRDGVGLGTTRARLVELYGSQATLAVDPAPERGTVATLVIPWHTTPVAVVAEGAA